jgi:hypothetical protein
MGGEGGGMEAALGFNYRNKWSEGEERTELAEGPADLAASHVRPYGDGGGGEEGEQRMEIKYISQFYLSLTIDYREHANTEFPVANTMCFKCIRKSREI